MRNVLLEIDQLVLGRPGGAEEAGEPFRRQVEDSLQSLLKQRGLPVDMAKNATEALVSLALPEDIGSDAGVIAASIYRALSEMR